MTNKLPADIEGIREVVARQEHEQWMRWAKNIMPELKNALDKLPEGCKVADTIWRRLMRWELLLIPYSELTEEQKNQDRKEADIVLSKLTEHGVVRLAEDQSFPEAVFYEEETAPTQFCKGYREAEHNIRDDGFKKVVNFDGTPVKEG